MDVARYEITDNLASVRFTDRVLSFPVILRAAKSLLHAYIMFLRWIVDVVLCDITDNLTRNRITACV